MDGKKPDAINVILHVPVEEKKGFAMGGFIRIIVKNIRLIAIVTGAFLLLGIGAAAILRALPAGPEPAPPSTSGTYSIILSFTHEGAETGLAPDGKTLNILDRDLILNARESAGLPQNVNLESRMTVEWSPYTALVSLQFDDALAEYESKIPSFLENFAALYERQFMEMYEYEISYQSPDLEQTVSQFELDTSNDYPLFVYETEKQIQALLTSTIKAPNLPIWRNLLSELASIAQMIEEQGASKDRQALLRYFDYELPLLRRDHALKSEQIQALTELLAASQNSGVNIAAIINDTLHDIQDMVNISDRILRYEHWQTIYEGTPAADSFPAVESALNSWIEKAEALWNEGVDEYMAATVPDRQNLQVFISSVDWDIERQAPSPPPSRSFMASVVIPIAGMTFLGLFISLFWAFGKNALTED